MEGANSRQGPDDSGGSMCDATVINDGVLDYFTLPAGLLLMIKNSLTPSHSFFLGRVSYSGEHCRSLSEKNELCLQDLKNTYIGVLKILSKYLESTDRYTKGHSVRVSELAMETAIAMQLPQIGDFIKIFEH